MSLYNVWHKNDSHWGDNDDATLATFPTGFTHVADVEADAPGHAFELTNHIDRPWWDNEGVTVIGEPRHRSTSVGDVIVGPNTKRFSVNGIGFKEF